MSGLAAVLFCALVVACFLAVLFLSAALHYAGQRNEATTKAKQLQRELDGVQADNTVLRQKLTRRKKALVGAR